MANHRFTSAVSACFGMILLSLAVYGAEPAGSLRLHLSWGHASPPGTSFSIGLVGEGVSIGESTVDGFEPDEALRDGVWQTRAGGGDVDGVDLTLRYADAPVEPLRNLHSIWRDLIAASDPDTARRLQLDAGFRRDARKLTVSLDRDGTRGFSVTLDQLLQSKTFWVPALDVYLAAGDPALSYGEHQKQLETWKGKRILDAVQREPEAAYADYTARWEDMGSPAYKHPAQRPPGHIVGLTWDSAIPKFGIDRGAGVWNDYGNPDRFRFWFDFGDWSSLAQETWKGQSLADGLPVVTTVLEKDGVRYEVEQFAYPLQGPPGERRGDIAMVLLQKVKVSNLEPTLKTVPLCMTHRRELPAGEKPVLAAVVETGNLVIEETAAHRALLAIAGPAAEKGSLVARDEKPAADKQGASQATVAEVRLLLEIPARESRELVVKLPSPVVPQEDRATLLELDYAAARRVTLEFWSAYVARGAQFRVPEKVVNDLFRANLWHALRLPRRHGGEAAGVKIDLPYSNFAYGQQGTPWPVNQAVYVDYMLYDLRGYHGLALEELLSMYGNNQEPSGHVSGVANWGVYTPGMIYASAQHFLLSHDRESFDRLLLPTLKALDWCLDEIRKASAEPGPARGLVRAPLNDGTGEGLWAFNQAYFYAGLDVLGQALERIGHPRARQCREAAGAVRASIERAFASAAARSPLVELRDHTWRPYVPCEALTPLRMMDIWYPTDVDTGAVHLLRLKALAPGGDLADWLLEDHEDNLFLKGWGMANEPVYNQQATAYLLRDDPRAAIRAFYSMMACAFSHSVLEPVEHRWTWGQYFGPPSTDGAWFELYRRMLIHELDDGTLLLFQAAPRAWLRDGRTIEIERAPTYYGTISLTVTSQASSGRLSAEIDMPDRSVPQSLVVRFRHPDSKPMRGATVNGETWTDFDAVKEWVRVPDPQVKHYSIVARYE